MRWIGYGCAFFLAGSVVLRPLVRAAFPAGDAGAERTPDFEREFALWGALAASILLLTDLGRLWHQTYAFYGGFEPITLELIGTIANDTLWGEGLRLQAVAAAVAVLALALAGRGGRVAWSVATVAIAATLLARPLTGHAVESGSWASLPALLQMVHVGAAALWIGTLAALALFVARRHRFLSEEAAGPVVARLVNTFSPLALTAASALFVAGCATSFLYLGDFESLYTTAYGRVLAGKILAFGGVVALGYRNWQRVRPLLGAAAAAGERSEAVLLRTAGAELAMAALVLLLTAVLVVLPMPMQ